jgi:hypothetical protein
MVWGQPKAKPRDPVCKINKSKKVLRVWLKWYSACLVSIKSWVQSPVLQKKWIWINALLKNFTQSSQRLGCYLLRDMSIFCMCFCTVEHFMYIFSLLRTSHSCWFLCAHIYLEHGRNLSNCWVNECTICSSKGRTISSNICKLTKQTFSPFSTHCLL